MNRQAVGVMSGALLAGRRSRSPGSATAVSAQLRRQVTVTREVLLVNAAAGGDDATAREAQYLRQRSEQLESQMEQGRQGVAALETRYQPSFIKVKDPS